VASIAAWHHPLLAAAALRQACQRSAAFVPSAGTGPGAEQVDDRFDAPCRTRSADRKATRLTSPG